MQHCNSTTGLAMEVPDYFPFHSRTALNSALRRHPASLLPKFQHDPALLELMRSPVTQDMISKRSLMLSQCH